MKTTYAMHKYIPFNKPSIVGNELEYIRQAVDSGKISGNGVFTKKCQSFFESRYGFRKTLLTTSGTDALEMAAILCHVEPGDEVIVPSFTFVSSALAFVRQGATIVFADSLPDHPNIDPAQIEALVTPRTKVVVVVHYAGCACDMDAILDIAHRHGLMVVEDAAQAVDSWFIDKSGRRHPLGGIGDVGCFSFHETKNVISGEGGMLVVNNPDMVRRSEIVWEKGTNRAEFFRGEVNKYGWVDVGSSFLPSELTAAFLYAQLEHVDEIQKKRVSLWNAYAELLNPLSEQGYFRLPVIPPHSTNNAHCFYLLCNSLEERSSLIAYLKGHGITAVFHYLPLHSSPYFSRLHDGRSLPCCDAFADRLVRLPLFFSLTDDNQRFIADIIRRFFQTSRPNTP